MQLDCLVSVMFHDKIWRQLWLTVIDFLSSFQTHLIYLFFNRVLFIAPGVLFLCVFVGINTASTVSQLYSGNQLSQPCFCVSRQGLIESLREIGHFCDGSRFGMFWGFFYSPQGCLLVRGSNPRPSEWQLGTLPTYQCGKVLGGKP